MLAPGLEEAANQSYQEELEYRVERLRSDTVLGKRISMEPVWLRQI